MIHTVARSMPYRLALLVALMSMSIDIHVPALSAMVKAFDSTEETLQLSVSLMCLGLFLSGLFMGPMADAWGRRRMLTLSLVGFFVSSVGCFFAPNLDVFLLMRFIQGFMAAGAPILVMTILYDWYSHEQFAKMGALMGMVITFSLACAPVIGGHLATFWDWRAIFIFLAVACVVLGGSVLPFLPETLKEKRPFSMGKSFQDYRDMLSSWAVVGHILLPAILIGFVIGHISVGSYYFVDELHIPQAHYGYFQAAGTLGNVLFCLLTSRWVVRFGSPKVLKGGVLMAGLSGVFFLVVSLLAPRNPYWLTAPLFFYSAGIAMVFSPAIVHAMRLFGAQAGTMSSLVAAIRTLVVSVVAYGAGLIYQGTAQSLAVIFATGALLVLVVFVSLQSAHPDFVLKNEDDQK